MITVALLRVGDAENDTSYVAPRRKISRAFDIVQGTMELPASQGSDQNNGDDAEEFQK
jgi:hypothetical protein